MNIEKRNFGFIAQDWDCFREFYKYEKDGKPILCMEFSDLEEEDAQFIADRIARKANLPLDSVVLSSNGVDEYEAEIHGMDEVDIDKCVRAFEVGAGIDLRVEAFV